MEKIIIDIKEIYGEVAKISLFNEYLKLVKEKIGKSKIVVLTGAGPVWLYLKLAHELHGKVQTLYYDSPVTGEILVFEHNPF